MGGGWKDGMLDRGINYHNTLYFVVLEYLDYLIFYNLFDIIYYTNFNITL